jgi:hypothetical protein
MFSVGEPENMASELRKCSDGTRCHRAWPDGAHRRRTYSASTSANPAAARIHLNVRPGLVNVAACVATGDAARYSSVLLTIGYLAPGGAGGPPA